MDKIDIDINGEWAQYDETLKLGWLYPCYFCNTLTS